MKYIIIGDELIDNDRAPDAWESDRYKILKALNDTEARNQANELVNKKQWRKIKLFSLSSVPLVFNPK